MVFEVFVVPPSPFSDSWPMCIPIPCECDKVLLGVGRVTIEQQVHPSLLRRGPGG